MCPPTTALDGASGFDDGDGAGATVCVGDGEGEGRARAGAGAACALSGDVVTAQGHFARALALLSGEDARAVQRLRGALSSGRDLRTGELPW